jgi:hypothetical protein
MRALLSRRKAFAIVYSERWTDRWTLLGKGCYCWIGNIIIHNKFLQNCQKKDAQYGDRWPLYHLICGKSLCIINAAWPNWEFEHFWHLRWVFYAFNVELCLCPQAASFERLPTLFIRIVIIKSYLYGLTTT